MEENLNRDPAVGLHGIWSNRSCFFPAFQAPKAPVKKGQPKKVAAVPAAIRKKVEKTKKEVNPLFEKRAKNYGIGMVFRFC